MFRHYERRGEALLPRAKFFARLLRSAGVAGLIVLFSLAIGSCGYHFIVGLPWLDALLNAAMILTGMGPVDPMRTPAGKLFAAGYALYSGIAFLSMMAVVLAPVFHRLMHRFHLEEEDLADSERSGKSGTGSSTQ